MIPQVLLSKRSYLWNFSCTLGPNNFLAHRTLGSGFCWWNLTNFVRNLIQRTNEFRNFYFWWPWRCSLMTEIFPFHKYTRRLLLRDFATILVYQSKLGFDPFWKFSFLKFLVSISIYSSDYWKYFLSARNMTHFNQETLQVSMVDECIVPIVYSLISILNCEIIALLQISFKLFRPEV